MRIRFLSKCLLLAGVIFAGGCDQNNQGSSATESLQRRVDEKERALESSKLEESNMKAKNAELQAKVSALEKELEEARTSALSPEKLTAVITPIIKSALQESLLRAPTPPVAPPIAKETPVPERQPELSPPKPVGKTENAVGVKREAPPANRQKFDFNFDDASSNPARPEGAGRESQNDIRRKSQRP